MAFAFDDHVDEKTADTKELDPPTSQLRKSRDAAKLIEKIRNGAFARRHSFAGPRMNEPQLFGVDVHTLSQILQFHVAEKSGASEQVLSSPPSNDTHDKINT